MLPPPVPLPASPTPLGPTSLSVDLPVTPAPQKARLGSLEQQIRDLVSQKTATERKHRGELAGLRTQLADAVGEIAEWKDKCKASEGGAKQLISYRQEVDRVKAESAISEALLKSRSDLTLHEQYLKFLSFKGQLNKAESVTIMRDHKLTRFKARETSLERELDSLVATHNLQLEDHEALLVLLDETRLEAQSLREQLETSLEDLERARSDRSKGEGELLLAERADLETLRKAHSALLKTTGSQTTEIASLQTRIANLEARETNLKDEKAALIKEEKIRERERERLKSKEEGWEDRERELLDEVDTLRAALDGVRERERREKDRVLLMRNNSSTTETDLRKELEGLEEEVEIQVEETKRVEAQLIMKEKEVRSLKKTIATLESSLSALTTSLSARSIHSSNPAPDSGAFSGASTSIPKSEKALPSKPTTKARAKAKIRKAASLEPEEQDDDSVEDVQAEMSHVDEDGDNAAPASLEPVKLKRGRPKKKDTASDKDIGGKLPIASKTKPLAKVKKPIVDDEEEKSSPLPVPTKKKVIKTSEVSSSNMSKKRKPVVEDEPDAEAIGTTLPIIEEKKKKRKLGMKIKPALDWDFANTEGGEIPTVLSPIKGAPAPLPLNRGGLKGLGKW
ncbi:hypothetical protein [Phaffia rhodozyma]|uniref:Uncharacterized protein n=1 Tax=Phaffia rhodozyma TaxID=264483 RepID=A0A0F7SIK8_PHARH|nr:hypothetical protein [Phaffia rhodozyma]